MRPELCSDDESDSYPRVGYRHSIDSSRACLALGARITWLPGCLHRSHEVCPIVAPAASPCPPQLRLS